MPPPEPPVPFPAPAEAEFLARRTRSPEPEAAFERAMASVLGAEPAEGRVATLREAGRRIVREGARTGAGPAYHNQHHVAETVLAMGKLCRAARDAGLLDGAEAAAGVVAMAGHDLEHDGSVAGGGVLEARSWRAVARLAAGVAAADLVLVEAAILGTDPALVAFNARQPQASARNVLCRLANEADVFASMLPRLGLRLSRLLAAERLAAGGGADPVGTAAGRLRFLGCYPAFSGPARSCGLEAARCRAVAAYAEAGRELGAGHTAEAGAAELDRLAPAEAEAAYLLALEGLG